MVLTWLAPLRLVSAQSSTGTILGRVTDPSGSGVPGAEVRVLREETNAERSTTTSEGGEFAVSLLPAGRYRVTASHLGFRTSRREGIRLEVDEKARIDFALEIGPIEDILTVRGDAPVLQTGISSSGSLVDSNFIRGLPLNGRMFLQLALIGPGSGPAAPGSQLSRQGASGLHLNGARESDNNFLLDGIDNNDWYINLMVVSPSVDYIQEFRVETGTYSAEFGRNGGSQVLVVTRSGSNSFHGTAYEFLRNAALDARNFFDPAGRPIPQFQRNQFGFLLGGPVRRDRVFFSSSYEGTRQQQSVTRTARVPTAAEKGGDFSGSGVSIIDPLTQQPFPGSRIPMQRLDLAGAAVAALYPNPNRPDPQANFVSTPVGRDGHDQWSGRADWQITARDSLLTRYSYDRQDSFEPFSEGVTNLPGFGDAVAGRAQNLVVAESHIFSGRLANDARLGFNRLRREVLQANLGNDLFAGLGIHGLSPDGADSGLPAFVVPGYDPLGDNTALPIARHDTTLQVVEGLSWLSGRHNLKAGGEVRKFRVNGYNHLFARGQFNFQGVFTGNALADLLLGMPVLSIRGINDNLQALRAGAYNAYLQDDWRVRPNLTLNLGVRYEFNSPPVDADDRMVVFDFGSRRLVPVGEGGVSRSGLRSDTNDLAPRIGISWSPGTDHTVLRAAYGIFHDANTLITNSGLYFNPPFFQMSLFFPTRDAPLSLSDPFPATAGFEPPTSVNSLAPDFPTAYAQHWTLTVEREMARNTVARLGYLGSKGSHLIRRRNLNQPDPGPGDIDARRPIPGFADISLAEPAANSIYHALQASLERRFAGGTQFLAAYTYSRSIDDASDFLATNSDDNYPQDNARLYLERGLSNFDLRHRLVLTGIFDLPEGIGLRWGARAPKIARTLLGGWRLGTIAVLQSGFPFTPRLSQDNSNTGNIGGVVGYDRPNLAANPLSGPSTPDRFFNTDAFVVPARYTFGNSGRNILSGPGFVNLDLSLSRRFFVVEGRGFEFRAEFFNAFNSPPLGLPQRDADQPATFGKILTAGPSRQIQFAAKLEF